VVKFWIFRWPYFWNFWKILNFREISIFGIQKCRFFQNLSIILDFLEFWENFKYLADTTNSVTYLPDVLEKRRRFERLNKASEENKRKILEAEVKKSTKIDIVDFFDPRNIDHLKAWREMENCKWPEGFLPSEIKFSEGWTTRIRMKLADCWIDYMIGF
jgi:hypothetical protein